MKEDNRAGDGLTNGTCNVFPTTCTNPAFTEECHEWVYNMSVYQTTAVTQYDLVCSRYVHVHYMYCILIDIVSSTSTVHILNQENI